MPFPNSAADAFATFAARLALQNPAAEARA
jgi:hypothetical protein